MHRMQGSDVFLSGLLFYDLVLHRALDGPPKPGGGDLDQGHGIAGPGGIANFAVSLGRLGLRTSLAAAFGDDFHGRYCWDALETEGVDLAPSRRLADWGTPVTVSLAYQDDRALVTHGAEPPGSPAELLGDRRAPVASVVHLGAGPVRGSGLIFADLGWDPSQEWSAEVLRQLDGATPSCPTQSRPWLHPDRQPRGRAVDSWPNWCRWRSSPAGSTARWPSTPPRGRPPGARARRGRGRPDRGRRRVRASWSPPPSPGGRSPSGCASPTCPPRCRCRAGRIALRARLGRHRPLVAHGRRSGSPPRLRISLGSHPSVKGPDMELSREGFSRPLSCPPAPPRWPRAAAAQVPGPTPRS